MKCVELNYGAYISVNYKRPLDLTDETFLNLKQSILKNSIQCNFGQKIYFSDNLQYTLFINNSINDN